MPLGRAGIESRVMLAKRYAVDGTVVREYAHTVLAGDINGLMHFPLETARLLLAAVDASSLQPPSKVLWWSCLSPRSAGRRGCDVMVHTTVDKRSVDQARELFFLATSLSVDEPEKRGGGDDLEGFIIRSFVSGWEDALRSAGNAVVRASIDDAHGWILHRADEIYGWLGGPAPVLVPFSLTIPETDFLSPDTYLASMKI